MGQQIGLQCAVHGFPVVLNDVSEEQLERGRKSLHNFALQMAQELNLAQSANDEAVARIEWIVDPASAAEDIDLLIESVPEDVWLKRRVFANFDKVCPAHTLFATNTSTLLPHELAKYSQRPKQFAALHFHPNVWDSNVVDVMPGNSAAPEIAETLREFALAIGQQPIVYDREYRGYVVNRFLFGVFREAMSMAAKGVVSPEEIDQAFKGVLKADTGPFGLIDRIGLDTMLSINEFWCKRLLQIPRLDPVFRRNRKLLESYVSKGHLGVKSGQGFYRYPESADSTQPSPDATHVAGEYAVRESSD
jgi:3-hydroxybutyryl-CoA dehydrogenase